MVKITGKVPTSEYRILFCQSPVAQLSRIGKRWIFHNLQISFLPSPERKNCVSRDWLEGNIFPRGGNNWINARHERVKSSRDIAFHVVVGMSFLWFRGESTRKLDNLVYCQFETHALPTFRRGNITSSFDRPRCQLDQWRAYASPKMKESFNSSWTRF